MSNKHPNLMLFEAYDENWQKYFYDADSNGYVVIHNGHGKDELPLNLPIAMVLASCGERIELLENSPDGLTADATRNGETWEFKTTVGSYSSVQNRLRKGKRQSRKVLLALPESFENVDVLRGLLSSVNSDSKNTIEMVSLLFFEEHLVELTREEIRLRDFKKFWAVRAKTGFGSTAEAD